MTTERLDLFRDTRGSATVEFGIMAMVYVVILFGLLVVSEMGMLTKRVQTESRVLAWNTLCPEEIDVDGIRARLESLHHGRLVAADAALQSFDPHTVDLDDNSSTIAVAVLDTVVRRMEGRVEFDFQSPWKLGYPGDGDPVGEWDIERRHMVDTRSRVMFMPARTLPVIVDPDGDVDDPGHGGGGHHHHDHDPEPKPTLTP